MVKSPVYLITIALLVLGESQCKLMMSPNDMTLIIRLWRREGGGSSYSLALNHNIALLVLGESQCKLMVFPKDGLGCCCSTRFGRGQVKVDGPTFFKNHCGIAPSLKLAYLLLENS